VPRLLANALQGYGLQLGQLAEPAEVLLEGDEFFDRKFLLDAVEDAAALALREAGIGAGGDEVVADFLWVLRSVIAAAAGSQHRAEQKQGNDTERAEGLHDGSAFPEQGQ
jgi:hypothetical protein